MGVGRGGCWGCGIIRIIRLGSRIIRISIRLVMRTHRVLRAGLRLLRIIRPVLRIHRTIIITRIIRMIGRGRPGIRIMSIVGLELE